MVKFLRKIAALPFYLVMLAIIVITLLLEYFDIEIERPKWYNKFLRWIERTATAVEGFYP